jgi:LAS superfamily LD-carboxypeptidase LdcB
MHDDIPVAILTGQTEEHLIRDPEFGCLLHRGLAAPLSELAGDARAAGFELAVASGFRSFSRQCTIWNDKVEGRRKVLDDAGRVIDLSRLDDWEKVRAILRWSALPGASRHHWGTDLDVFDRGGLSPDYPSPQLTEAECVPGGVFGEFHRWLDETLQQPADGFYRPYTQDRGGVGCEPWHISYRPLAQPFQRALGAQVLGDVIRGSGILLGDIVLARLDEIYQRYVVAPA